jgi:(1->4)-alpha-D-glucan 1-alpha-D-glucosylmutase
MRFQQFTAPVAAKGVEDTALYRFNRLVSLNEVGGDPEQFGISVNAFHAASTDRAVVWPHTMLATSTHDNKRSEDVRARIDVISEMPAAWRTMVRRWARMNRSRKQVVNGVPAPSRNDEYLLYQTLVGTFPHASDAGADLATYCVRIASYMRKAAREAKVHTSWLSPDEAYENALAGFVSALLGGASEHLFLPDLRAECAAFAWFGMLNSLSMTLLKLASPGVPDLYQGSEFFDFSLVDPDNRRPVDYAARERALDAKGSPAELLTDWRDGRVKQAIIARALAYRRRAPGLFANGNYQKLRLDGKLADHAVAFARAHEGRAMVTIVTRLAARLDGLIEAPLATRSSWQGTAVILPRNLTGRRITDILGGSSFPGNSGRLLLADLLAELPVALLEMQ